MDLRNQTALTPVESGHLIRAISLNLTTKCNLACSYCNPRGTPILMADGSKKPIERIVVGDEIMGFTKTKTPRLIKSTVEWIGQRQSVLMRVITTKSSFVCTPDHKWWDGKEYTEAKDLKWAYYVSPLQKIERSQVVVKSEPTIEEYPVYSMQTSTGNYIAHGFASKNCFSGCFKEYEGHDITKEMAFKTVDWLMDPSTRGNNESVDIGFWGGEPLVKWDLLKEIVLYAEEAAAKQGIEVTFGGTTNVTLLTEDKFDFMDEHRIHFLLSCDGVERHHDQFRKFKNGRGSWSVIDKNIEAIIARWPHQEIRMSFTAENVKDIIEDLEYFVSKGFKNIVYSPVSEGDWTEEKLDELATAWEQVAAWYLADERYKDINIKFIDDACSHLVNEPVGNAAPCGAGRGYIGVNYDGALYPCLLPENLIQTSTGLSMIKLLDIGDHVLTHTNQYKPITNIWRKQYYGVSSATCPDNIRISNVVTADHPIYVLREGKEIWVPSASVEPTDYLIYPIDRPAINTNHEDMDMLYLLGRVLAADAFGDDPIKIYPRTAQSYNSFLYAASRVNLKVETKALSPERNVIKIDKKYKRNRELIERKEAITRTLFFKVSLGEDFLKLSNEEISAFLDGLFHAGPITTNSYYFANEIKNLILYIRKIPRIEYSTINYFKKEYSLHMIDESETGFFKGNFFYDLVRKNELDRYIGQVINLEVEGDHSYTGENIIYKNCHRFCKFEDSRPWYEKEVVLGHVDYGILNHDWRKIFVNWDPDKDCADKCKDCPAFKLTCTGGCWATNYDLSNKDLSLSPEINCRSTLETINQAIFMIQNLGEDYFRYHQGNILPEVQGCECYNIQDHMFGRYKMNKNEPYRCLCNISSYGDRPKQIRNCTCYNLENAGRGYFDQSGVTCGLHRIERDVVKEAIEYLNEKQESLQLSVDQKIEILDKLIDQVAEIAELENLDNSLGETLDFRS